MTLTAREWLLLPREEQLKRGDELSPSECYKLRMELSYISFSEEQKDNMSVEEKYRFTHPKESTKEEKYAFSQRAQRIFEDMIQEVSKKAKNEGETK